MGSRRYAALLRDPRWKKLRAEIVALDDASCAHCGRGGLEKRGHVHHKRYLPGLKPWEYPPDMLETLCAGCHAAEHGIITPKVGWVYVNEDDRGELCEECEYCSEPIRYVFTIWHKAWGLLDVGTDCCDRMTGTSVASESMRTKKRRERFVSSSRWRTGPKSTWIKQGDMRVFLLRDEPGFRLMMRNDLGDRVVGKLRFPSLDAAKERAFDVINDGSAKRLLEEKWRRP